MSGPLEEASAAVLLRATRLLLRRHDPDVWELADPPSYSDALHAMRAVVAGRADLAAALLDARDGFFDTRAAKEQREQAGNRLDELVERISSLPEWRKWSE